MVGQVGFEPTQPKGNRFTVCRDSPTSPLPQNSPGDASGLAITLLTFCRPIRQVCVHAPDPRSRETGYTLAYPEGLEPPPAVLETDMLPLH